MLVTTESDLRGLAATLRKAGRFGIDTEFVQERTYFPVLGLVQVATESIQAAIDPVPVGSLQPLVDLIEDPAVLKIAHAAQYDFDILYGRTGKVPKNVFDTQIAAAFVGYGDPISYGKLVERVTGVLLAKLESRSDWTHRPLSPEQIAYALDDVRYLPALKDHLAAKLAEMGRSDWARESFAALEDRGTYARPGADEAWRRVRGIAALDPRGLAVLRELAAWRETAAEQRDVPRQRICKDDVLVDLARRTPTRTSDVRSLRFMHPREAEASAAAIVAAVRKGLAAPPIAPPAALPEESASAPVVSLLEACLLARAEEERISPRLLASRADLATLAASHPGSRPSVPVLAGWRRELVGQALLDVVEGRLALRVDAGTGKLSGVP